MLARKVGGKEAGGVAIGSQIDELRHAALNFGSNLLELADIADRRVKAAQALKSILPHLVEAGSADAQDGVKQRSALQAQGARARAQRSQEQEAAKSLVFPRERPQPGPKLRFRVIVNLNRVLGVGKKSVADKIIFGRVIAADKYDGQGPAGPGSIAGLRAAARLVGETALGVIPPA